MAELALGIHYLTGYAVATDPTDRQQAEWPPHPARVFMALAAAHFETGEDPAKAAALRWLEKLPAPALALPHLDPAQQREVVTVYVPVNDKAGPSAATLQSAPSLTRSKQPRTFPRIWVGDEPVYLIWPEADGREDHRQALASLCAKVTRLGHSSSLVQMWVADRGEAGEATYVPEDVTGTIRLRQVSEGCLAYLAKRFNREQIDAFAALDATIRTSKGKAQREAKAQFEQRFGIKWKSSLSPPISQRPTISLSKGYARATSQTTAPPASSHFDPNLLILSKLDGPALGLETTLQLTRALRGTVMGQCPQQPPPEWLSGHTPEGQPSEQTHLAILPLPFVSREHADGHVMGLALAFPRQVAPEERGQALAGLLTDESGLPAEVRLKLGRVGEWTLEREQRPRPPLALQAESWTRASHIWASVTPVVLDRFPKTDRRKECAGWNEEVAQIVATSCQQIDLPRPVAVEVGTTSWHIGAPRAVSKRRPLRGDNGDRATAPLGSGFPMLHPKASRPPRPQVHVRLHFAEPVEGPVLLGAGRYLGYGLCKPLSQPGGEA